MNFQFAIALAGLYKDEFDMHQFEHMESTAWAQLDKISFEYVQVLIPYIVEFNGP